MGTEYTLRFQSPSETATETELRRIPGAAVRTKPSLAIEYRREMSNIEAMPDATVQVEGGGLYFCDHGGFGREYLGLVIARLVGAFGLVQVEERE